MYKKNAFVLILICISYITGFSQNDKGVQYTKGDSALCAFCKNKTDYRDNVLPKYYDKIMSQYNLNFSKKMQYEKTRDSLSLMLMAKNLKPATKVSYEKMKAVFKDLLSNMINAKYDDLDLSDISKGSDCASKAKLMFENMPFNIDRLNKEMDYQSKCIMNESTLKQKLKDIENKWTTVSIVNSQEMIDLIKLQDQYIEEYEKKLKDGNLKISVVNQIVNEIDKKCAFIKCEGTKKDNNPYIGEWTMIMKKIECPQFNDNNSDLIGQERTLSIISGEADDFKINEDGYEEKDMIFKKISENKYQHINGIFEEIITFTSDASIEYIHIASSNGITITYTYIGTKNK